MQPPYFSDRPRYARHGQTFPPEEPADALVTVARSHDTLRGRLGAIDANDAGGRASLVQACLAVKIQERLEDELVLPTLQAVLGHRPQVDATLEDRDDTDRRIEQLLSLPAGSPGTAECFGSLVRTLERSFADVEIALFSALEDRGLDLDELGRRIQQRRREILLELGLH
jgi:hypothetical protein